MIDVFTPTVLFTLIAVAALLLLWLHTDNNVPSAPPPAKVAAEDSHVDDHTESAAPSTCGSVVGRLSTTQLCRSLRLSYGPRAKATRSRTLVP